MAPTRDGPPLFAEEPLEDVQVMEDRASRLLIRGPLTVVVRQPHQESHADGDQIVLGGERLGRAEAEGPVLGADAGPPQSAPRDAGQPEVPDPYDSPKHQRDEQPKQLVGIEVVCGGVPGVETVVNAETF